MSESAFEVCGHCSKGSSATVPKCPHCGVRKAALRPAGAPVAKRVEESPEIAYTKAYNDFEAGLEKFSKAHVGKGINAFLQTDEGRALADVCNETRVALDMATRAAPHESRVAKGAARETAFEKLESGLVAFCKSRGIARVWSDGLAEFATTTEGAALKRAYDDTI